LIHFENYFPLQLAHNGGLSGDTKLNRHRLPTRGTTMVMFIRPGPVCLERDRTFGKDREESGLSDDHCAPSFGHNLYGFRPPGPLGIEPSSSRTGTRNFFGDAHGSQGAAGLRPSLGSSWGASWSGSLHDDSVVKDPHPFSKPQALSIGAEGMLMSKWVIKERQTTLEVGKMDTGRGIIVHQTDGPTAKSALDQYKTKGSNGAHFLIDKDGAIYQTASVKKRTPHVGKLKSRCVLELRCPTPKFDPAKEHQTEKKKTVPDRFPSNEDAIGIELVGLALPLGEEQKDKKKKIFETVTEAQNSSLAWLIGGLSVSLKIPLTEVFRHPVVSYKNETEASTAKW
jgi:hypothetical protein